MTNTRRIPSGYKIITLIFIVFLFMWSLFFFLKPDVSEVTHTQELVVSSNKNAVSHSTLKQHVQGEVPRTVSAQNSKIQVTESKDSVLFDTKSDMTIQPVDPNTDPANKIDNN